MAATKFHPCSFPAISHPQQDPYSILSTDSFGPSVASTTLLCPRLTSHRPETLEPRRTFMHKHEISSGIFAILSRSSPSHIRTKRSVSVPGSSRFWPSCPDGSPCMRFMYFGVAFGQKGFLQIRPRGRHPCPRLALPLIGCAKDFHLLELRPTRRTKKSSSRWSCFKSGNEDLIGHNAVWIS